MRRITCSLAQQDPAFLPQRVGSGALNSDQETSSHDDAHRGHVGGQRPVQLVPVLCLRHRRDDHPVRESSAIRTAQRSSPSRPSQNPGPGRSLRQQARRIPETGFTSAATRGNGLRRRNDHSKLRGQRSL
jgi:hypothetical protein